MLSLQDASRLYADAVEAGAYAIDIDGQSSGNYAYDELGNLTQDLAEQIATIQWTVYGKIKSITRTVSSTKPDLEFEYSPDGHRTMKKVTYPSGRIVETYYIRDASGNIMSVYTQNPDSFIWSEAPIYGSSRVGVYNPEKVLLINGSPVGGSLPKDEKEHIRGYKRYELSNHLGNVLAVVSDKRTLICVGGNQYYEAEVITASDYYPFGMIMPDRTYSSGAGEYQFGFNGMEDDEEVSGDGNSYTTFFRQYDSRIGRWGSVDPVFSASNSPYISFGDNPIIFTDIKGDKIKYDGNIGFKIMMWSRVQVIKIFSPKDVRKTIRELEKSTTKTLTISKSDHFGFDRTDDNNAVIYTSSRKDLKRIVQVGPEIDVELEDGSTKTTFTWMRQNKLFALTNELSHAINWFTGKIDETLVEDEIDGGDVTQEEVNSNIFENKLRKKLFAKQRWEKTHVGMRAPSKKIARKMVKASKIKDLEKRQQKVKEVMKEF